MIFSKCFILIFCGLLLNTFLVAQQKDSSITKTSVTKKKQPCPVDTHGVSLDTDGDGVPDCRDKEILTQQQCFPVDSFGVGKCPEPPCCAEKGEIQGLYSSTCTINNLPSLNFRNMSPLLNTNAKLLLDSIALQINANPLCNLKINGYYSVLDKKLKQKNQLRAKMIHDYIVSKGVAIDRLTINIQPGQAINRFDFIPY